MSAALTIIAAPAASAQTCAGALSFNFAPLQVRGAGEWSPGIGSAAGSVAAGSDRVFSALSTGVHFAEHDQRVAHIGLAVGTDQPLSLDNRLHLCPIATLAYARGQGSAAVGAGGQLAVGWVARNATNLTVVPSAAFGVRQLPGDPFHGNRLRPAAEIQAAIGFLLRGRVAVTPRAMFARRQPARVAVELTIDAR